MNTDGRTRKPFTARFVDEGSELHLELVNETDETPKCVEIMAIFLKDEETPGGGPSRENIKFESVKFIRPKDKVVFSHRTWIDGKPAAREQDQMERLRAVEGTLKPYVLDISWEDAEGKTQYQRIPVGH